MYSLQKRFCIVACAVSPFATRKGINASAYLKPPRRGGRRLFHCLGCVLHGYCPPLLAQAKAIRTFHGSVAPEEASPRRLLLRAAHGRLPIRTCFGESRAKAFEDRGFLLLGGL